MPISSSRYLVPPPITCPLQRFYLSNEYYCVFNLSSWSTWHQWPLPPPLASGPYPLLSSFCAHYGPLSSLPMIPTSMSSAWICLSKFRFQLLPEQLLDSLLAANSLWPAAAFCKNMRGKIACLPNYLPKLQIYIHLPSYLCWAVPQNYLRDCLLAYSPRFTLSKT